MNLFNFPGVQILFLQSVAQWFISLPSSWELP